MSDSDKPLPILLEELPSSSMTTRLLSLLDYAVPGEWQNITSFEGMVKNVTGEDDESLIQQVGERAIKLYNDPENGYQRAVWIYQMLDDTQTLVGIAALGDKLSGSFDFLSFLDELTPKADTAQAVDAGVKLLGELAAFCYTNGLLETALAISQAPLPMRRRRMPCALRRLLLLIAYCRWGQISC